MPPNETIKDEDVKLELIQNSKTELSDVITSQPEKEVKETQEEKFIQPTDKSEKNHDEVVECVTCLDLCCSYFEQCWISLVPCAYGCGDCTAGCCEACGACIEGCGDCCTQC